MEIKKCLATNNDCYKKGQKITPKGIVVHSTGANNPYLKRYVQPDDGLLGKNTYNNDWNRSGLEKCMHGFIGKDKNGTVRCYQTLPFNYACWGAGKGNKGSYNYNPAYIQFEICEDALNDANYFNKAFQVAIEFCAYLVKKYNIDINNVVSHYESHKRGYASNHGDCDHWLKKFGKDMNWFRSEVQKKVNGATPSPAPTPTTSLKYSKSDKIVLNGYLYRDSFGNGKGSKKSNYKGTITIVNAKGSKPYHIDSIGWVAESDITKQTSSNTSASIKVGDKVKIKKGAKSYEGVNMASFVYNNTYRVDELKGNRAVLDKTGICTAFNVKDLIK